MLLNAAAVAASVVSEVVIGHDTCFSRGASHSAAAVAKTGVKKSPG